MPKIGFLAFLCSRALCWYTWQWSWLRLSGNCWFLNVLANMNQCLSAYISLDSSVFCPLWKRTKKDFWLWTGNPKKIHQLWLNKNFSRRGNTDVETLRSVIEDSENLVWALVIPVVTTEGTMSKWKAWQWIPVESGVIVPSADIPMINFSSFVRLIFWEWEEKVSFIWEEMEQLGVT